MKAKSVIKLGGSLLFTEDKMSTSSVAGNIRIHNDTTYLSDYDISDEPMEDILKYKEQ